MSMPEQSVLTACWQQNLRVHHCECRAYNDSQAAGSLPVLDPEQLVLCSSRRSGLQFLDVVRANRLRRQLGHWSPLLGCVGCLQLADGTPADGQ